MFFFLSTSYENTKIFGVNHRYSENLGLLSTSRIDRRQGISDTLKSIAHEK